MNSGKRGGRKTSSRGRKSTSSRKTGGRDTSGSKEIHKKKKKFIEFKDKAVKKGDPLPSFDENIRLNKFLSNAGICSRREADVLIETGVVSVNGEVVREMGYKVKPTDTVQYDGQTISLETKRYVLLNKPKNFVTNMYDPDVKSSVMRLVEKACRERIYPVDRLDRNTTGLLLFTNDSDMAKKLSHPKHLITKIYHVECRNTITVEDLEKLKRGIVLDDGRSFAIQAEYIQGRKSDREIGIEVQSGKNKVVQRMIEQLGNEVVKMDRVSFAGLTKKDLPRGYWRFLTEKEVAFLKMAKA